MSYLSTSVTNPNPNMNPSSSQKTVKFLHCCAPGCNSYDVATNFLHFPNDSTWRRRWFSTMPPQNAVIDHNSVLCLKHFSPRDVAVCSNILKEATGITEVRYGTPLVREGATPTIFLRDVTDGTQNELKELAVDNPMFESASRDYTPQTFGELEGIMDGLDFIVDFTCLRNFHSERLSNVLEFWYIYNGVDFILFYNLDCTFVPRIVTSIKINKKLLVTVYLDGREMDLADLAWIVPITGRVNRWSQIELLMKHFIKV